MAVTIELTFGDFFDRLSILEIKHDRIADPEKRQVVARELARYSRASDALAINKAGIAILLEDLKAINAALWDLEDNVRDHERRGDFDAGFIELARSIYRTNDQRADIKRRIDQALGSDTFEVKHFRADTP